MFALGSVAFASPWLLLALFSLPLLWLWLRITPPAPRLQPFPALFLLRDLVSSRQTAQSAPPWLLLLRLALAALVILAMARPVLNPQRDWPCCGPFLIVIDNGWSSGPHWPQRQAKINALLQEAERLDRPVALLATAPDPANPVLRFIGPLSANALRSTASSLVPRPWPTDRSAAIAALQGFAPAQAARIVWLSDGLASAQPEIDRALHERLGALGNTEIILDSPDRPPLLLHPAFIDGQGRLAVNLSQAQRPTTSPSLQAPPLARPILLDALDDEGRTVRHIERHLDPRAADLEIAFDLPVDLRNAIAMIRLSGVQGAGAISLMDESARRRPVGLVSVQVDQGLLSAPYYIERALQPFAEIRRGDLNALLGQSVASLILPDSVPLPADQAERLLDFVNKGGTLIRFAGPKLAESVALPHSDPLLPVPLYKGGRALGGALSWSDPAKLAPFDAASPYYGLNIPDDVVVRQQVLAQPSPTLDEMTWARLSDGTPLITARRQGRGLLALFHANAAPDWSSLPLSGLFVELLRRTIALSAPVLDGQKEPQESAPLNAAPLAPARLIDGFGRIVPSASWTQATAPVAFGQAPPLASFRHPPGFYGQGQRQRALNLAPAVGPLAPLAIPDGTARLSSYEEEGERDLRPPLLAAALALLLADMALSLWLRGLLPPWRWAASGRALGLLVACMVLAQGLIALPFGSQRASAQGLNPSATVPPTDESALKAAARTWFAYALTGDPQRDAISKAGLEGLARILDERTSVDAAGAMAVDFERDELAFFPLIYWPLGLDPPPLSPQARDRVNAYLRQGGMLVIDSVEGPSTLSGPAVQKALQGLDIPPLTPLPADHVLSKSFYLLQTFPGRRQDGVIWVEATDPGRNDGVSSIILGAHDWAAAWAIDANGRPLYAVTPGPERQREMAYRVGVNMAMYALTGSYKADQVHIPAILERLGQ
jgi:Domain of unknown function (DUF4159)/Aerotolerance regulator N-terminal